MAAGFAGNLPEWLRVPAALVVVLVLPAMLLDRAVVNRGSWIRVSSLRIPFSFLLWLSLLAIWSGVFTLVRAPFHVFVSATMWLMIGAYAGAVVLSLTGRDARRRAENGPRMIWAAVAACILFAALIPQRLTVGDDTLDHVGYVRRIVSTDSLVPRGVLAQPIDASADSFRPDPRKGAFHPVLAFVSVLSQGDPVDVWRWLTVVVFPVLVLAVCSFNGAFLGSGAARVAAAVLVLLSFHGTLFRFARAAAHGESLAALWCWTMTAAVVCGAGGGVRRVVWVALALGGVLVHLGVIAHTLVLMATLVCLGAAWGIPPAARLRIGIPLALGTALAMILRARDLTGTVNLIHAHMQGVLFVTKRWFVASPMEILRVDGILFLGGLVCIPWLLLIARSRPAARAVLAAAAIPFAFSFVPWVATPLFERGSYMVFRSLLNVPAYAAIVICALSLGRAWKARKAVALLLGVPAAILWIVIFMRPVPRALVSETRARFHAGAANTEAEISPALVHAVAALPSGSVILSDPATSYALSAVTSQSYVAVANQHDNPRDPYALDRLKAVRDVLSPYVIPSVAMDACRRFAVNYVVVNGEAPRAAGEFLSVWSSTQLSATLARLGTIAPAFSLVDTVAGAYIYRFEPGAPVNWTWSAEDQPVRTASLRLTPCDVPAPKGEFEISGVSVWPERALPGDTVQVTLGYRHDAPSAFGLPVVVHVRFDHSSLGNAHEFPGEKIVRRVRDGRAGVRSRFRDDFIPGHGVYAPDLWPVGHDLCESFVVVVPPGARTGRYTVRVALAYDALVPNFHLRDILYNRDHYSGRACATFDVVEKTISTGTDP